MSQASLAFEGRNPDVLTCIANLSNDEVFTPPEFANQMLDARRATPGPRRTTVRAFWADHDRPRSSTRSPSRVSSSARSRSASWTDSPTRFPTSRSVSTTS